MTLCCNAKLLLKNVLQFIFLYTEVVTKSLNFLKEKYEGPLKFALDIGCGTGKSTEHLIDHFDEGN